MPVENNITYYAICILSLRKIVYYSYSTTTCGALDMCQSHIHCSLESSFIFFGTNDSCTNKKISLQIAFNPWVQFPDRVDRSHNFTLHFNCDRMFFVCCTATTFSHARNRTRIHTNDKTIHIVDCSIWSTSPCRIDVLVSFLCAHTHTYRTFSISLPMRLRSPHRIVARCGSVQTIVLRVDEKNDIFALIRVALLCGWSVCLLRMDTAHKQTIEKLICTQLMCM